MKEMFKVGRELREKYKNDAQFEEEMSRWKKANDYPAGTVHTVVDHIEHVIKIAGVDHVGLGSDYDGIKSLAESTRGCVDLSVYHARTPEPRLQAGRD